MQPRLQSVLKRYWIAVLWAGLIALQVRSGALPAGRAAADLSIYADALATGWQDWSWDTTVNRSNAAPVHSGTASIAVTYDKAWGGLYLHANAVSISAYDTLQFWLHGGVQAASASRSASTFTAARAR